MEPGIEATACACELLYVYVYNKYLVETFGVISNDLEKLNSTAVSQNLN